MYEEFFHLSAPPFRLNPDPKFFFGSKSHNKAMAYLHYGLRQGEGFIVITGEIGAGKTVLIGHLLDQLDRSNIVAAHLLTTNFEAEALLSHILSAFRISPSGSGKSAELEAFEDFLFDQLNRGRRVLLIVDEAQNLPAKTLEELRMLSNMDYDGTPLFQVFLVGQPQFRTALAGPDMEQFRQRVIASYHLEPLGLEETKDYIRHRLSVVGWSNDPAIADAALAAVYERTHGVPRKINKLANRVLLHCALEKIHAIDKETVKAVASDLDEERLDGQRPVESEEEAPEVALDGTNGAVVVAFAGKRPSAPVAKSADVAVTEQPAASAPTATELAAPAEPEKPAEPAAAPVTAPVAPSVSSSVFDRLRARKQGETPPPAEVPAPATLEEVAEAIAAASARGPEEIGEAFAEATDEEDFASAPAENGSDLAKAIDETRAELKEAHANVQKLRRRLSDFDRRRREKRQRIAANLTRAEELLAEIRNAWR